MLVVKIELWPMGDRARAAEIGRVYVGNDGTGTEKVGHYWTGCLKETRKGRGVNHAKFWRQARVEDFPRKLGVFELVRRCLVAALDTPVPDAPAGATDGD